MKLFIIAISILLTNSTSYASEWKKAKNLDCLIWNPVPQDGEEVTWSGDCVDGYAHGYGTEQWYQNGRINNGLTGYTNNGKFVGEIRIHYPEPQRLTYFGGVDSEGLRYGAGYIEDTQGNKWYGYSEKDQWLGPVVFIGQNGLIFEHEFVITRPIEVKSLMTKASEQHQIGNLEQASHFYLEALKAHELRYGTNGPEDKMLLAFALINSSRILDFKNAILIGERLVNAAKSESKAFLIFASYYLPRAYLESGRYEEAFEQFRFYLAHASDPENLMLLTGQIGDLHCYVAINYPSIAERIGVRNEQLFQEGLSLLSKSDPSYFSCISYYSRELLEFGRIEAATNILNGALKDAYDLLKQFSSPQDVPSKFRLMYADLLFQLSHLMRVTNNLDDAENFLSSIIRFFERISDTDGAIYSKEIIENAEIQLGEILASNNKIKEAKEIFSSIVSRRRSLESRNLKDARILTSWAKVLHYDEKYSEAIETYKAALKIYEKNARGENVEDLEVSTYRSNMVRILLAQALLEAGRVDEAVDVTTETEGAVRADIHYDIWWEAQNRKVISSADAFLKSFMQAVLDVDMPSTVASQRLISNVLASNQEVAELVRRKNNLELDAEILSKKIRDYFESSANSRVEEQLHILIRQKKNISAQIENLKNSLSSSGYDDIENSINKNITIDKIRASIEADSVFLYFYFPKSIGQKSFVWSITKEGQNWEIIDIGRAELMDEVAELRKSLSFSTNSIFDFSRSFKIYQKILEPILRKTEDKKTIYFLSNGVLDSLPLQILTYSEYRSKDYQRAPWFGLKYAIINLPSVSHLLLNSSAERKGLNKAPLLAFGDPVFNSMHHTRSNLADSGSRTRSALQYLNHGYLDREELFNDLPRLRGSGKEVLTVSQSLRAKSEDVLIGELATESVLKKRDLSRYNIIYFATHSLMGADLLRFSNSSVEPALVLSNPDMVDDDEDGLLLASEIARLKLDADLVVLSACNTAVGPDNEFDYLSSLSQAFIHAGARSLLVTHWELSDEFAVKFLPVLFQKKNEMLPTSTRLQLAMRDFFSNRKNSDFFHPKFWGLFSVIGGPARSFRSD